MLALMHDAPLLVLAKLTKGAVPYDARHRCPKISWGQNPGRACSEAGGRRGLTGDGELPPRRHRTKRRPLFARVRAFLGSTAVAARSSFLLRANKVIK